MRVGGVLTCVHAMRILAYHKLAHTHTHTYTYLPHPQIPTQETTSRNTLPPAPSSIAASSLLDSSLHGHSMHGQGPGDAKLDISCERTPAQVGSWFGGIINLPARKRRERSIMS